MPFLLFLSLWACFIHFLPRQLSFWLVSFLYLQHQEPPPVFKQISSTINHWSPISISIVNSIVDSAEEIRIYKWERSLKIFLSKRKN